MKKELVKEMDMPLSIINKCDLLELPRSSYYYNPKPIKPEDIDFMNKIDEIYTEWPFLGSRRIRKILNRKGYKINRKKVQRLMRIMGIQAIYPKKWLSIPNLEDKKYPYLLKNLNINRPDMVWCADITYIRLKHGFVYLVVVMDWYSRYIKSWRLSTTLENCFCVEALDDALSKNAPEYFNTDQGCQFTSNDFIEKLKEKDIKISMDSKGRAFDNIFIERLWRSVKYDDIYLKEYETVTDLWRGLRRYFDFHNYEKPHQALNYQTPYEVYCEKERLEKAS